jgi:hypothetical protein
MIAKAKIILKMFAFLDSSPFFSEKKATGDKRAINKALCVIAENVPKPAVYKKITEDKINNAEIIVFWILATLGLISTALSL